MSCRPGFVDWGIYPPEFSYKGSVVRKFIRK